mmetsp:Transcript_27544/g.60273  ORF Transcript_27544/g.60273 Transcript_27544/m.60273 type:complete len:98 (-) Transcript_27544:1739-2032(-)
MRLGELNRCQDLLHRTLTLGLVYVLSLCPLRPEAALYPHCVLRLVCIRGPAASPPACPYCRLSGWPRALNNLLHRRFRHHHTSSAYSSITLKLPWAS